jgi:hypothetical protein
MMSKRRSLLTGSDRSALAFASAAPRRFYLHHGVTQERPTAEALIIGGRPRAAGEGGARAV